MTAVTSAITSALVTTGIIKLWSKSDKLNPIRFPVHHGTSGLIITSLGALANSPAIAGAGVALMVDDISDFHEWHKIWPHNKRIRLQLKEKRNNNETIFSAPKIKFKPYLKKTKELELFGIF